MIINPIIPVWIMGIICILLLFFKRKGIFHYIRQILIVVLLFVINLRIMVPGKDVTNLSNNVDILFVVDNTISMLAEDYNGNDRRIDAVKEDCKYIMEQFPGASFSVVTFGNSVERTVPYTVDYNMALQAIEVLNGQMEYYASGTSLNDVMSELNNILKNERDTYKIIFFISDGEVINSEELKSYSELEQYVDAGAVLGYGTKKGGAMRPLKYTGDEEKPEYLYYYDEDYNEVKAISKIDEGNLKQIASDFGIDYVHMTKQSEIHDEIKKLQSLIGKQADYDEAGNKKGYVETYYFFAIPLLLLLIFDYIYYKRKL
ncbi:MAG: VWA domain-containing protein [Lachnospiraceae bacterium]|nr:VWA domain-containing protein [Lachnospiraceae bacterium]